IVIEDEDAGVRIVLLAAHARVAGTEIAVGQVFGHAHAGACDASAAPGAVIPVSGDDDPLFTQRMPAFFPHVYNPMMAGRTRKDSCTRYENEPETRATTLLKGESNVQRRRMRGFGQNRMLAQRKGRGLLQRERLLDFAQSFQR